MHSIAVSKDVLDVASDLKPPGLRSLESIHLASALSLGSSLTYFVAYDLRLRSAASLIGLETVSPA